MMCLSGGWGARRPFALPGTKSRYAPDRQCDVKHVRLEITVDLVKGEIRGTSTSHFSPIVEGVARIQLDAQEMEILKVEDGKGRALTHAHLDAKLDVEFPRPLGPGEDVAVRVTYTARPRSGLYFVRPDASYPKQPWQAWSQGQDEDSRYWFPCYDFPNARSTSEVLVTVPERFFAVSNGRLVAETRDKGAKTRTFHWKESVPHVSYLLMIAVGEFAEVKETWKGLPVSYFVPRGREADARRTFGRTTDMLEFFSRCAGLPYPYEKYAQVCVANFIFGGMENISATTLRDEALYDARAALDFDSDPLISHELAHQWWGDLLTCKDWAHAWLNEGFATYFEGLYAEHHKGADEFAYNMLEKARGYLDEDRGYRRPIVTHVYQEPIDLFDRHLYEKASWVLHMLRRELGEGLFWKGIRLYAKSHQGRTVETKDLQGALSEVSGRTLEGFFQQWIFKGGHPELTVKPEWLAEDRLLRVTVSQGQKTDAETPVFQFPLEIAVYQKGGKRLVRAFQVTDAHHDFFIPLSEAPMAVSVDPLGSLLKTLKLDAGEPALVELALKGEGVLERIQAVEALAKLGSARAIDTLARVVLEDRFWGVAAEAAKGLGQLRGPGALDALVKGTRVKHPKVRRAVASALAGFRAHAAEAAKALLPLARKDESYFVQATAVYGLGAVRWDGAWTECRKALTRPSHEDVIRSGALRALGELRDPRAVPLLKTWSAYRSGKSYQSRVWAVEALGRLAEWGIRREEIVEWLSELLEDPAFHVRRRTIRALADIKDHRVIPVLERAVPREVDGRLKRGLKEAVRELQEGASPDEGVRQLREDLEKVREEAKVLKGRLNVLETAKASKNGGKPK